MLVVNTLPFVAADGSPDATPETPGDVDICCAERAEGKASDGGGQHGYDIGFGIYFDWSPVTNRSITVHISESSDDEDEEEELEGHVNNGDVEKGSKTQTNSNLAEILPVYRQDSHLSVNGGSHEFPGEGTYLLKFDNSYSLWRNKTLYYRVYYSA
ncbi:Protein TMED8 [Nibea albiflora]|uniref:Protein TMED8 n=1 Tax=Nibea albiflora TaxID=240163 RepID=A0ACB7FHD5_NIBAL|nr:Protein TMED8 [Nibea albiflora]